jgi:hypothetical protein
MKKKSPTKKLTPTDKLERDTERWQRNYPGDRPCPESPADAAAWRRARGLDKEHPAVIGRDQERYAEAMAEKLAAQANQQGATP